MIISVGLDASGQAQPLVFVDGVPTRAARAAVAAAVLTRVAIAAYTTVDGVGVHPPGQTVAGYTGWLFLLQGPVRWRRWWPAVDLLVGARPDPHLLAGLAGGVLSLARVRPRALGRRPGALGPHRRAARDQRDRRRRDRRGVVRRAIGRSRIAATVLVAAGIVLLNLS